MADASSAPVALSWQRQVGADLGAVRAKLQRVLREQGFDLMGDTVSSIEAVRGSQLAAFVLQHDKLPMTARIRLLPQDQGCEVMLDLAESGKVPSRFLGVRNAYAHAFSGLQAQLDQALAETDPKLQLTPVVPLPKSQGVGEQIGATAGDIGHRVVEAANRLLEGKDTSTPTAWKELDQVYFGSSKGHAVAEVDRVQSMLTVAGLVASHPGSMPPNLAHEVEVFAAKVEAALDAAGGRDAAGVEVADPELPVLAFLATQATIRESLPVRTLHICNACKMERVTNPDYERLAERNRKLRALSYGLGATFSRRGVTPFVLVGQLVRVKKLDPDFVCTRCQGTVADEFVVTFCPKCGDRRSEAVLRKCPKCQYDFRKAAELPELWQPGPPPALPPYQPAFPATAPAPGYPPHPGAPSQAAPRAPLPAAGWYTDPTGRHPQRWWDGAAWAQWVFDNGQEFADPLL